MTANLTIPTDVWACKQPGVPLVAAIVEGDSRWDGASWLHFPPADLVALRDARCDVLEFEGPAIHDHPDVKPCPRCVDGRLLHDVRVLTPYLGPTAEPNDAVWRTVRCLVDVVPVVEPNRGNTAPFVCLLPQMVLLNIKEGVGDLTPAHVDALAAACGKPPADWVGGYAVILTTTDQEDE